MFYIAAESGLSWQPPAAGTETVPISSDRGTMNTDKGNNLTLDHQASQLQGLPAPAMRMRRLRTSATVRAMVRETHLRVEKLIYPLFIVEGAGVKRPISSMPDPRCDAISAPCFSSILISVRVI